MSQGPFVDYYEVLQVSPTAEQDTIHRVYRLLAQRVHPDNRETGDAARFREVTEAFHVIGDAEKRAQYDAVHQQERRKRWRVVADAETAPDDFEYERGIRLAVLDILYGRRRVDPLNAGLYARDIEELVGRTREQMEFTVWYLVGRGLLLRNDKSQLVITVAGVDFLEEHYAGGLRQRLLRAPATKTD